MTHSVPLPAMNAMRVPSGDHDGELCSHNCFAHLISAWAPEPSAPMIHSARPWPYTILRPSGDQLGELSPRPPAQLAPHVVSLRSPVPSGRITYSSEGPFPKLLAKAITSPFGDHAGLCPSLLTRCAPVPSTFTTHMPPGGPNSPGNCVNAMRRPSGDHVSDPICISDRWTMRRFVPVSSISSI